MTDLLRQVLERAEALPAGRQDELAHLLLTAIESDNSGLALTAEQIAEVKARLVSPGEIVGLDEVRAELVSWSK